MLFFGPSSSFRCYATIRRLSGRKRKYGSTSRTTGEGTPPPVYRHREKCGMLRSGRPEKAMPKPWRRGTRQRGDVAATDLTAGPAFVAPCEPVLVRAPPSGPEWLHEVKLDGYRMVLVIDRGVARIHTKRGLDWTSRMPGIAQALSALKLRSAVIDGEAIIEWRERRSRLFRPARGARQGQRARCAPYGLRLDVSKGYGRDRALSPNAAICS